MKTKLAVAAAMMIGFANFVFQKHQPVVGQCLVNLAGAVHIPVERAAEMLLTRKIAAIAHPHGQGLGAQSLANFNAFHVVRDRLGPSGGIGVRQAAEFVAVRLPVLVGERVGVDCVKCQMGCLGGVAQFAPIAAGVPRYVQ